eukprot:5553654-Amphidinium_carterae.1
MTYNWRWPTVRTNQNNYPEVIVQARGKPPRPRGSCSSGPLTTYYFLIGDSLNTNTSPIEIVDSSKFLRKRSSGHCPSELASGAVAASPP